MYNNLVQVTVNNLNDLQMMHIALNWEKREEFYKLLLDYLPTYIRQIIPIEQGYRVEWTSIDEYKRFINDIRYTRSIEELKKFSIDISWI